MTSTIHHAAPGAKRTSCGLNLTGVACHRISTNSKAAKVTCHYCRYNLESNK